MTRIALVVLDTLRKDRFDECFDWLPGLRFENAYATANWTAPAHASMFTGRYPQEVGTSAKSTGLTCPETTVAEELAGAGYETVAYSANYNVSARNGFDRGFAEFVGPTRVLNPDGDVLDIEAFLADTDVEGLGLYGKVLRECVFGDHDTLRSLRCAVGKKFGNSLRKSVDDDGASVVASAVADRDWAEDAFLFVNLMEAHTPYDPPDEYNPVGEGVTVTMADTFTGVDDPERVRRAYDGAAAYLSATLRDVYEDLVAAFDYVITLSDHGELLGEHGYWNHTYGLYPEVTRVPLVVTDTARRETGTVETPVSLLDVYRTIRDLAGLEPRRRGQSLADPAELEARDRLVEYRGLISVAHEGLRDAGLSDDEIAEYETPMDALAGRDGCYRVFEDEETVFSSGTAESDPVQRYRDLVETLEPVEAEADEVSDEAMDRLEDLGYA